MNLRLGDVPTDEVAQWRVIGHPFTTGGGKTVNVSTGAAPSALSHRVVPASAEHDLRSGNTKPDQAKSAFRRTPA